MVVWAFSKVGSLQVGHSIFGVKFCNESVAIFSKHEIFYWPEVIFIKEFWIHRTGHDVGFPKLVFCDSEFL